MLTYRTFMDGDLWGFELMENGVVFTRRVGFHSMSSAMFAATYFTTHNPR